MSFMCRKLNLAGAGTEIKAVWGMCVFLFYAKAKRIVPIRIINTAALRKKFSIWITMQKKREDVCFRKF